MTKLHRPTWVKELFFSLQTAQKLSLNETCDWVMQHMPSVFCPNGKPLMPSTVCTWKKQMEREDNAPHTSEPPQKKKHGPKPSGECGVVPKSKTNNTKVPDSLLCLLEGDDSGPVQCWVPIVKHFTYAWDLLKSTKYHGYLTRCGTGGS